MAQTSSSECDMVAPDTRSSVSGALAAASGEHPEKRVFSVRQKVPILARLLMLPLLLGAFACLSLFVSVTGDLWRGASESDLWFGQVVGLVGAVVLGIPALLGISVVRFVTFDISEGWVEEVQDFRMFSKRRRANLSEFAAVRVSLEQDVLPRVGHVMCVHNVNLVSPRRGHLVEVASFATSDEAHCFGKDLARRLGLGYRCVSRAG